MINFHNDFGAPKNPGLSVRTALLRYCKCGSLSVSMIDLLILWFVSKYAPFSNHYSFIYIYLLDKTVHNSVSMSARNVEKN